MSTSNTYNFNLDIIEIIEEAYERAGLELRTGYDLTTARRSLDLLLTEWANSQINLWTLDQTTLPLVSGTATYTINDPTIDILDAVVRLNSTTDVPAERISIEEYLERTDKTATGRPVHYSVQRHENSLTLSVWPVPDVSTYNLIYHAIKYVQDIGSNYTNNPEIPRRFLPALISGLAYKIAQKNPARIVQNEQGQFEQVGGVSGQLRQELKLEYMEAFELARGEDRDRSSFYVVPKIYYN